MVVGALKCFLCWSRVRELVLKSVGTQDLQREGLCLTIKTPRYLLSVFLQNVALCGSGGGGSNRPKGHLYAVATNVFLRKAIGI